MYLVAIAWAYVALMMAVAEATNTNGTVLGAIVTFVLYGVLPITILVYLMGSPARNRARKARERAEWEREREAQLAATQAETLTDSAATGTTASASGQPDASGHATTAAQTSGVTPVREER
jgi:hypothetical protein